MTFALPESFGDELAGALRDAFGEDIVFAFVFGSFAKGFGKRGHDIDTFICLARPRPDGEVRYAGWLRGVHERYGCGVDERFPYELVTLSRLAEIEGTVGRLVLSLETNDPDLFDVVTWVQVLSDAKAFVVGSRELLARFERSFADVPSRWKASALSRLSDARARALADDPPLHFIKHVYPFTERK